MFSIKPLVQDLNNDMVFRIVPKLQTDEEWFHVTTWLEEHRPAIRDSGTVYNASILGYLLVVEFKDRKAAMEFKLRFLS